MRGLIKGPAPTNVSPPTQEQCSLGDWEAAFQTSIAAIADSRDRVKHARTRFNSMHKLSLRALLFAEQRYLCVYCECQIDEVYPPPPVAHWNPLSVFIEQAFNWNNLHLSCLSTDTCDDWQKDQALNLPWPTEFLYEDALGFTSGGWMYVRTDVRVAPQVRRALLIALDSQPGPPTIRSTLNLNNPALRAARAAAIEAEETVAERQPPMSGTQREQRARELLTQPRRAGFVSSRVAYLQGQLGVGR